MLISERVSSQTEASRDARRRGFLIWQRRRGTGTLFIAECLPLPPAALNIVRDMLHVDETFFGALKVTLVLSGARDPTHIGGHSD